MTDYSALDGMRTPPRAGDAARAAAGRVAWRAAALEYPDPGLDVERLAADEAFGALLDAAFGNSPFLSRALVAEPDVAPRFALSGPAGIVDAAVVDAAAADRDDRPTLMRRLRRARTRVAATVALADLAGVWTLAEVTGALSRFADAAVGCAARHLLRAAAGDLALAHADEPERDSGLVILALGKLGARELNYSSDIDLMVLYDGEVARVPAERHPQALFVRLTRELVRILQERTADGYVQRVDLRLRPDPASTPLAISVEAAELYYESLGQNWERAAMIKARAIAGDIAAGERFLGRLVPFVWRKHLDFAAIQDIHSIKRQINAHRGGERIAVAGHDIKVGRGGIREIEFFAQTQQLIWGGRTPALRARGTCETLRALAAAGRASETAADELIEAYGFLRTVEHRLQMIDDRRTQTVPAAPERLRAFATFLGFDGPEPFARALRARLETVERRYAALFEEAPDLAPSGSLVFTGTEDDPDTIATIGAMGFGKPSVVAAAIRGWHHGRYRAMRSTRARELLTEITPTLLAALARTADPDAALARFDEFLRSLPAGVQLFSLFYSRPKLLDLVAQVMGTAPRLASILSHNPILFDSVLAPEFDAPLPAIDALVASLAERLSAAADEQDVLDFARRWTHDRQFQIGVRMLRRDVPPEQAHAMFSGLAEAVVRALLPQVERLFAGVHGRVPGAGFAVLGLGKLGGREMTATSDLDLVFVYDVPPGVETSDGAKPLPATTYFTRLGQRLLNALSAPTAEGGLYDIDMRLRPSGAKGPVASELAGFLAYQREAAWTWEHMALTRARVLAAPEPLRQRLDDGIRDILGRPRPPGPLAAEIAAMRQRIAAEHPAAGPWDVKYAPGGLIDIEFIAQWVQLRDAHRHPELLATGTIEALTRAAACGSLSRRDARALIAAARLQGRIQGLMRLTMADQRAGGEAPPALRALLAWAGESADVASLRRRLRRAQARAARLFAALVTPAGAAGDPSP